MRNYFSILLISVLLHSCVQNKNNEADKVNQSIVTTTISKTNTDTILNDNTKPDTEDNSDFCVGMENAENMPDSIFESAIELERNKVYVSRRDSSVNLVAKMSLDHRIFGFEHPDITSKRLILYSVFTCDVKNNPFHCNLGAFYDTQDENSPTLNYLGTNDGFAEMNAVSNNGNTRKIYIKEKWIEYY